MIAVPLKTARGDILGILQIINAQDENQNAVPFTKEDESLMQHFASIAAVALERAQMTRSILLRMIRMSEMRDPKEAGHQFDPELVEIFFSRLNILRAIQQRYQD